MEEVCIIGEGNHSSNSPRKDELVEAGVPFIRATNLVAGRISGSEMRFLSPQKHAQLRSEEHTSELCPYTTLFRSRKDELVEAGVPFIRATNLVAGRISGSEMRFLSPQKHAQL